MAKTDRTDAALSTLLGTVKAGKLTLLRPSFAADRATSHVELAIATRDGSTHFVGESIAEAAEQAAEALARGDDEPVLPGWRRLGRMQREIVLEALAEARAKHMRLAAEANVGRDAAAATSEYAKADAYGAAIEELAFVPVDENGVEVPSGKLNAIPPITPRTKPKDRA